MSGPPPSHVLDFLREHETLTLATSSPAATPRATLLRYASDDLTLYVWTRSQSWTAKQIEQNPLVSFTIAADSAGLQGSGQAHPVLAGDEVAKVIELFSSKFPTALGSSTMNISFFRINPSEVKLIDETYGGGRGETQMFEGAEYRVENVYNVLRDLPAGEIGFIGGKLHRVDLEQGEVIARQGAPADKFVIVLDGSVEVIKESDGHAETVTTLGPGDFFGEVAILRDTPRTATLRAASAATVMTMERDAFRALVAQSLGAGADFDRVLRERLEGSAGS